MSQRYSAIALPFFVSLIYLFLYLPIIVLVVLSFNAAALNFGWQGFSIKWYRELFNSAEIWQALVTSLIVALSAVALSLLMSVVLVCYGSRLLNSIRWFFYGTLIVPEVVLAVSLLSVFSFLSVPLGLTTLIVSHTLLGLGYAVPLVYARYLSLDARLFEASADLGATAMQTFFKITLPLLSPALLAASLLVFIISLDDFILSFFCSGATAQTLPMFIFSVIRSGSSPIVNALSTVMLMISSILVLIFCSLQARTRIL